MTGSAGPAEAGSTPYAWEDGVRLSGSLLWRVQRAFFETQGVEAWRGGDVPQYITCNPYIAATYARQVVGFLQDWRERLDPTQPVHIVELGAGSGRFAFYFLRQLERLLAGAGLQGQPVTYVMTDYADANIEHWRSHPAFAVPLAQGRLDFARFDVAAPGPIRLLGSGAEVRDGNPLVVIANYVLDTVPCDTFQISDGQLLEGLLTTKGPTPEPDLADPELLSAVLLDYRYLPGPDPPYGDPELDRILASYVSQLGNASLLFPVAALRCLRQLREIAGGRLLLLCADKGFHWEDDLLTWGDPGMVLHGGCFSMAVNFDALRRGVLDAGGEFLCPKRRYTSLEMATFLVGSPPGGTPATRRAFAEAMETFGPDEYFHLVMGAASRSEGMGAPEALSWLRWSRADPEIFTSLFPALMASVPGAPESLREDLRAMAGEVAANHFDLGTGLNLDFCLGTLLYSLGYYAEARAHLEAGVEAAGPDTNSLFNLSLCQFALDQLDAAAGSLDQLLAADPDCQPAKDLRLRVAGSRLRRGGVTTSG